MNQLEDIDIDALLKMVELEWLENQYVLGLSGGQKRRPSLLLTILNEPRLIFLMNPLLEWI